MAGGHVHWLIFCLEHTRRDATKVDIGTGLKYMIRDTSRTDKTKTLEAHGT